MCDDSDRMGTPAEVENVYFFIHTYGLTLTNNTNTTYTGRLVSTYQLAMSREAVEMALPEGQGDDPNLHFLIRYACL